MDEHTEQLRSYCIIDLETESNKFMGRTASPFCPDNYIVAIGWKHNEQPVDYRYYASRNRVCNVLVGKHDYKTRVLVAHNAKFDLLYLWEYEWLQEFFRNGGMIWDTQYAEYLLVGQHPQMHMNALNDIALRYGGTKKIDAVKDFWEQGKKTSEIPKQLLIDYLVGNDEVAGDIGNTELVYLGQLKKAEERGMLTMIKNRMTGLLATTMMEYNGVYVNREEAFRRLDELNKEYDEAQAVLNSYIPELPEGLEFSWTSKHHVSALVFGGAVKYTATVPMMKDGCVVTLNTTEKWPLFNGAPVNPATFHSQNMKQDIYLSGRRKGELKFGNVLVPVGIRTKKETFIFDFPGYVNPSVLTSLKAPKDGWEQASIKDARGNKLYKTGTDALMSLGGVGVPFTDTLTKYIALDKEIGTYYLRGDSGMLTRVRPDGIINHSLNHTSTVTGRLSGSSPNMQNIPRDTTSQVKRMFSSRFGDDGVMIEIDYSQIEVVVLALLSGDKNLIYDLNSGVDFHCKRVAIKNGISYEEAVYRCKNENAPDHRFWKEERTKCKIFGFQMQYGAGAKAIARDTGMTVEEVQDLMNKEKEMYPDVERYIRTVARAVERSARAFRDPQRGYRAFRRGYYQAPTGTMYTFRSYDAPEFLRKNGTADTFSPPEIRNYPVQGTAGEIVQYAIGRLAERFQCSDNYQNRAVLCNTVHDCVWIDATRDVAHEVAEDARRIMESIEYTLHSAWEHVPVQFKVAVEMGPNMLDLHHLTEGEYNA